MAPRASQRFGQASQSQANGRRTQAATQKGYGGRRRAREATEEPEDEQEQQDPEEDDEDGEEGQGEGVSAEDKMIADLVRLALFTEYKHTPLRRDDINKKVLVNNTRSFRTVFAGAEKILKDTFGMELVPLQTAGHRDRLVLEEVADGEDTGVVKKKITAAGPRSWILRNCLPEPIIRAAAERDPLVAEAEEDDWALLSDDPLRPEHAPGTALAWQSADDVGLQGLMFVILSLVLVNGRSMPDPQLRSYLKKLGVHSTIPIVTASNKNITLDAFLSSLTKLGYLDRIRTHLPGLGTQAPATQAAGRGRRARGSDDVEEGDISYEWRWGPRAEAEVGEKRTAGFIADVYLKRREEVQEIEDSEEEEEEQPARKGRGRGKNDEVAERRREKQAKKEKERKEMERILKEVERAAGGNLSA
ncbi:MAGE-domain-containing protein [Calocera cornea HHB12733]|uniref:MAGE-domain-containing protein n=1 Tax=Calocera cornea HHB12733 TaxID=1353952 RepID=A0A165GFH0_9BASI|nr:MAGE-domain-containing protein [Calocera cornea HHB12733]